MTHPSNTEIPGWDQSPEPQPGRMARAFRSSTRALFVLTLVVFLVGGFVLVGAQGVEIFAGDGNAVTAVGEKLGPPTFTVSAVCGLLAFVLEYVGTSEGEAGSD